MYNYLLFKYMGISFIFGFIVMIIFFIVNIYYRKQFSLYLKLHIKKSDMRMKLTTQTFNNLKVIKLYGWDDIFLNRIEKTRKEEIDSLNKRYIVTQISQTLLWLAPIAMSVAAIGAYQFLNESFKIEDIFTCIGIFTSIQNPMKNLPVTIDIILEALVSLSRIENFLSEPEINENNIIHNEKSSSSQKNSIGVVDLGTILDLFFIFDTTYELLFLLLLLLLLWLDILEIFCNFLLFILDISFSLFSDIKHFFKS